MAITLIDADLGTLKSQIYTIVANERNTLTADAFDKFLASLDPERDRAGERYEQIRRGLVYFFQSRGCTDAEDHADETINRVARKAGNDEHIRDPYTYVYGVARLILLEIFKQREKERQAINNYPAPVQDVSGFFNETELEDERTSCFTHCLDTLPIETRTFITRYYTGQKRTKIVNRKELAQQMGIPLNALRLRARRVRERLENCVVHCLKGSGRVRNVFDGSASN